MTIQLIPRAEFDRVGAADIDRIARLSLQADMCRANTLASVKRAGSGHLGSSFSSLDIVSLLYFEELNVRDVGVAHPDRDVYFSSKGHDVPGQYAVLYAIGLLPEQRFLALRRIRGTCGHPDVGTPGMEANTGSLGMGISKGKGVALAKRMLRRGGRVMVMTGDGELQEGQIYEALQTAAHQRVSNLHVIVDNNRVQSDKPVDVICSLGDLEAKLGSFGWHVSRCDGHDFDALSQVFTEWRAINDRPKILIADTIKGRGISFMEHPRALEDGGGVYQWHAGAPDDTSYEAGYRELIDRINGRFSKLGLAPLELREVPPEPRPAGGATKEYVSNAFGKALVEIAATRTNLVVLDADLSADCRIRDFEVTYPDRFIENGIAEQDMVSMAGGLALQGLLPVVNTFASFLAARSNEQIYNNACENTRIIYVCHYAGLIPAGPGQSHQSIRDISLFGALPDLTILQPCNSAETRMAVDWCVNQATTSCMLRLVIGPSPREIALPAGYGLQEGRGVVLVDGSGGVLLAYGPVMLHEALVSAEVLAEQEIALRVVNMPWLNRVDREWLSEICEDVESVYVVEDHSPFGGLGDAVLNALVDRGLLEGRRFRKFGVEGLPTWGTPWEALEHHGLDGVSLARRIAQHTAESLGLAGGTS